MKSPIEQLKHPSNAIFLQVGAIYAVAVLCIYSFSRLPIEFSIRYLLISLGAWAFIGWSQFALFNALHEGLHRRFGRPHREWLGYALTAYPMGFDQSYRQVHLDHHKYFADPDRDPDYPNYGSFPATRREFLWRMVLNLCGWYAILQFFGIRQNRVSGNNSNTPRSTLHLVVTQLILLMTFSVTVGWFYYFWLWLVPLVTFAKFFSSTRAFCEHASPDDRPTIRTITGSFPGEKVFGVFSFHYHTEHHEYVGVPYNQLREAHRLAKDTLYARNEMPGVIYEHFDRGYFQLLNRWYKALPL